MKVVMMRLGSSSIPVLSEQKIFSLKEVSPFIPENPCLTSQGEGLSLTLVENVSSYGVSIEIFNRVDV